MRVLLLVSGARRQHPNRQILDDKVFAVTALYAEFHDPTLPLPVHDVVFNAVGDAELCGEALAGAAAVVARTRAPVINRPETVADTDRATNAGRLAGPRACGRRGRFRPQKPALLAGANLEFPILLRSPGFHTGQHFVRVGAHKRPY